MTMQIVILTLVAVVLVLSWRLDEINLLGTFLLAALMLGLIWWKWTIKKKKDKATRTIALRILDNLDGTRQHALGNLQQAGPSAQRRIKKAIGEELRRRLKKRGAGEKNGLKPDGIFKKQLKRSVAERGAGGRRGAASERGMGGRTAATPEKGTGGRRGAAPERGTGTIPRRTGNRSTI